MQGRPLLRRLCFEWVQTDRMWFSTGSVRVLLLLLPLGLHDLYEVVHCNYPANILASNGERKQIYEHRD